MRYQSFDQALEAFKGLQKTIAAYNHVMGVTYLDAATTAPKGSYAGRGETMGVLSQITYDLIASEDNAELIFVLEENTPALDPQTVRELEEFKKQYQQLHRIPAEEYVAFNVLLNEAQNVWEEAKAANDFPMFAPYLEKIVAYNRKFAAYYDASKIPYDALLNEYEEGLDMRTLDVFFAKLRQTIVPLIEKISPAFKDEADVWMILNHILNVMLDFAVKVHNGQMSKEDNYTEHVFRVIYRSVDQYFKNAEENKYL